MASVRRRGATAALLVAFALSLASAAPASHSGGSPRLRSFDSLREACQSVPEIARICLYIPPTIRNQLNEPRRKFTIFLSSPQAFAEAANLMNGEANALRVYQDRQIARKWFLGSILPNALSKCDLAKWNKPVATMLQGWSLRIGNAVTREPCNFTVGGAPIGNSYIVGSGIVHVHTGVYIVDPTVADIQALLSASSPRPSSDAIATATGAAAHGSAVVPCPSSEAVARARSAHPLIKTAIGEAARACAAGWGSPATFLCSTDAGYSASWMAMAPEVRSALPYAELVNSIARSLYVPGQRLGVAELRTVGPSLQASAGNTIGVTCTDDACSLRVQANKPAVTVVEQIPLGESIMLLVTSGGSLLP